MPIYEYQCSRCGYIFEKFTFSAEQNEPEDCPQCGAPDTKRIISPFTSGKGGFIGDFGGGCGPSPGGFS